MLEFNTTQFIHETKLDGEKLISCNYISFGSYDNSCAVERANVRYLGEKDLIAYRETGCYGYEKAWLTDTEENRELLNCLENYPCFDDELVAEIEMEIETEYLKDAFSDLALPSDLKDICSDYDLDEIDYELYRGACDETNTHFVVEAGGNGYIDLKRIAPSYQAGLLKKYPWIPEMLEYRKKIHNPITLPHYETASYFKHVLQTTFRAPTEDEINNLLNYAIELEEGL